MSRDDSSEKKLIATEQNQQPFARKRTQFNNE